MEITAGVADGPQSTILEQVTNGLAIRMAVMERALLASANGAPAERSSSVGLQQKGGA
jgi:aspartate carbamoyltransferase catalytic subunit